MGASIAWCSVLYLVWASIVCRRDVAIFPPRPADRTLISAPRVATRPGPGGVGHVAARHRRSWPCPAARLARAPRQGTPVAEVGGPLRPGHRGLGFGRPQ